MTSDNFEGTGRPGQGRSSSEGQSYDWQRTGQAQRVGSGELIPPAEQVDSNAIFPDISNVQRSISRFEKPLKPSLLINIKKNR